MTVAVLGDKIKGLPVGQAAIGLVRQLLLTVHITFIYRPLSSLADEFAAQFTNSLSFFRRHKHLIICVVFENR